MKNLTIIAAIGKNNELGYNNNLIWRLKEDLQFFKQQTLGHYIAMGKNTFYSLPKLLPNRKHIVISSTMPTTNEVDIYETLDDFLGFAENINEEIFVVGGGQIYSQLLPYSNKLILTEIDAIAKNADVLFPHFDKTLYSLQQGKLLVENEIEYRHNIYTKL